MSRRFKGVTLGRLPRVLINILAMDYEERALITRAMSRVGRPRLDASAEPLAESFRDIIDMPKPQRLEFVSHLNSALDELLGEDAFGTEGQNDPRGDHRS